MHDADNASSGEVTVLKSRVLILEALVCELLTKNERLRLANSQSVQDSCASDLLCRSGSRITPDY
jgi:hypothetical protein